MQQSDVIYKPYIILNTTTNQMKGTNLKYLFCKRGNFHQGQQLNTICLHSTCQTNNTFLCCCACIQEQHQGHPTKSLKKMIAESQDLLDKRLHNPMKIQAKQQHINVIPIDIAMQVVNNFDTINDIQKASQISQSLSKTMNSIQNNLKQYCLKLRESLKQGSSQLDPIQLCYKIAEQINGVHQMGEQIAMMGGIKALLSSIRKLQTLYNEQTVQIDQQSLMKFITNSNKQINQIIQVQIGQISTKLQQCNSMLAKTLPKIDLLCGSRIFKFDPTCKHASLIIKDDFTVVCETDTIYKMALMQPSVKLKQGIESFRFKIVRLGADWVAVGVYHKLNKQAMYELLPTTQGHGCYLVSSNAGIWSSTDKLSNNIVAGFKFRQGDSITCIVSENKIYFVKDVPITHAFSEEYSLREAVSLLLPNNVGNNLYPCVVAFFSNTEVQYVPSFSSIIAPEDLPQQLYMFSSSLRHADTKIINNNQMTALTGASYKTCLLDRSVDEGKDEKGVARFSFRIVQDSGWVAVGVCYRGMLQDSQFTIRCQQAEHGGYLISSNGGTWSSSQSHLNNIIRSFKFKQGDFVQCTVFTSQHPSTAKIQFRMGVQRYQLDINVIPGDKLYPCVVLYHINDKIMVMPNL